MTDYNFCKSCYFCKLINSSSEPSATSTYCAYCYLMDMSRGCKAGKGCIRYLNKNTDKAKNLKKLHSKEAVTIHNGQGF